MASTDYIVITRDMVSLGLRGTKLMVFALIYGFCKDGESNFHGSLSYIADWCGISRGQASIILKDLVEDGYIERDGDNRPRYRVRKTKRLENQTECLENQTECLENQTRTDNIVENIDTSLHKETINACAYGEKVMMTEDEHAKLVAKFGTEDTARLCEILDNYLVNNPRKHYASHYRAILQWCVRELNDQKTSEQRLKNAQQPRTTAAPAAPAGNYAGLAEARARLKAIQDKYKN